MKPFSLPANFRAWYISSKVIVGENDISDAEQIKLDVAEVISQFMCFQPIFYFISLTVKLARLVCISFYHELFDPNALSPIHPIYTVWWFWLLLFISSTYLCLNVLQSCNYFLSCISKLNWESIYSEVRWVREWLVRLLFCLKDLLHSFLPSLMFLANETEPLGRTVILSRLLYISLHQNAQQEGTHRYMLMRYYNPYEASCISNKIQGQYNLKSDGFMNIKQYPASIFIVQLVTVLLNHI